MYVLVLTRKKRKLIFLLLCAVFVFAGILSIMDALITGVEINIGYRMSLRFPKPLEMSSVYASEPSQPYIQAGSVLGKKLKTETIKRHGLSEITFQYPETLRMGEIRNLGNEITVHLNFKHKNNKMVGFFQVWNLSMPFEEFIDNSKKLSSMTFTDFNESRLKLHGMNGIMWEYVYITRTQDIKGIEIFIGNGPEMYRFAAFIPKHEYTPKYKRIIKRMAKSLKIKNTVSAVLLMNGKLRSDF